jgi:hypothetical protein
MTSLEQALARIIKLIEQAKIVGDARELVALKRKRDVICAALSAPEQSLS